jgi:hypothetical protein
MGGNASKVGFEAIVKQLSTKEVNPTDYEVSRDPFHCRQSHSNVICYVIRLLCLKIFASSVI